MREKIYIVLLGLSIFLCKPETIIAQDTLKIGLQDFINLAIKKSGQVKYAQTDVDLAYNRIDALKAQRILPGLNFSSDFGLVPGVTSPNNLPDNQIYLDPDARNDWSNFGIFTRARINAVQPLFNWGAIRKAIQAAEIGAKAAEQGFLAEQANVEIQLFDLYYSYVLALEIEQLLFEAEDKIGKISRGIQKAYDEGDENLEDADVFKFEIFESQFESQKIEVLQSLLFIRNIWEYAVGRDTDAVYMPVDTELIELDINLDDVGYYTNTALTQRPEIKGLEAGEKALSVYMKSLRAQNMPGLFLGATTTFASTPIRPRQPNPFINSPGNTFNTILGFSIRQPLNFSSINSSIKRSKIEIKRVSYMKDAARDGIMLEVSTAFMNASISQSKVETTNDALTTAKEWLGLEQADNSLGLGDTKNLIEALRTELELKFTLKENVFEHNSNVAKLYRATGLPIFNLSNN